MFGARAYRHKKRVTLMIELEDWNNRKSIIVLDYQMKQHVCLILILQRLQFKYAQDVQFLH